MIPTTKLSPWRQVDPTIIFFAVDSELVPSSTSSSLVSKLSFHVLSTHLHHGPRSEAGAIKLAALSLLCLSVYKTVSASSTIPF